MNRGHSEGDLNRIKEYAFIHERTQPTMAMHINDLCDQLMADGPIENKFTDAEKKVILLTRDLWNAFIHLPIQHPNDRDDFRNAIHAIQRILGWRPMMRKGVLDV